MATELTTMGGAEESTEMKTRKHVTVIRQMLHVSWTDLRVTVTLPANKAAGRPAAPKHLIDGVHGHAAPRRLLAILGSSGAGKTTLLNTLAARLTPNAVTTGVTLVNGFARDKQEYLKHVGYVTQDDVLTNSATCREAIEFSAALRLPASVAASDRRSSVSETLEILGLRRCADTIVGRDQGGGISGGERKRVCIGIELVNNPGVLFLDEPTTGLDAYTASEVVNTALTLCREGRTVIATLHQPSSDIFARFDDLMLMHASGVAYHGAGRDLGAYLARIDHPLPPNYNPADFVMVSMMEALHQELDEEYTGPPATDFVGRWAGLRKTMPVASVAMEEGLEALRPLNRERSDKPTFWSTVSTILKRQVLLYTREKIGLRARLGQTLFFGLLTGGVYHNLLPTDAGVQDRNGMLFFSLINQMFSALLQTVLLFPAERVVFEREHIGGFYSTQAYFLARTIPDMILQIVFPCLFGLIAYTMAGLRGGLVHFLVYEAVLVMIAQCANSMALLLGSVAPTPELAVALAPMPAIPFIIVGGFFANNVRFDHWYFVWLEKLSFFSYCFEILACNEHKDQFYKDATGPNQYGNNVLETLNLKPSRVPMDFVAMVIMITAYRFLAAYVLERRTRAVESSGDIVPGKGTADAGVVSVVLKK